MKLPIDTAYAHSTDRALEGRAGNHQRSGCGVDRNHVLLVFLVCRQDVYDNLDFIYEIFGEQRPHGPVGKPAYQYLAVAGPVFAFDETAGNFTRGICFLTVIHREGEKVLALFNFPGHYRCRENNGFSVGNGHRTIGLLGQVTRVKIKGLLANRNFDVNIHTCTSLVYVMMVPQR